MCNVQSIGRTEVKIAQEASPEADVSVAKTIDAELLARALGPAPRQRGKLKHRKATSLPETPPSSIEQAKRVYTTTVPSMQASTTHACVPSVFCLLSLLN